MNEAAKSQAVTATRDPAIAQDPRPHSIRNGLLCALAVAACVLIANPSANMPFSDGFSYDMTALVFERTGHIVYNGWATAMLGWLIPWGALFIKLFGFSFTVMRLSMLPIDIAAVFLFHQILRRFGINSANAVFGTLALSLSPIFLPSAASFMTDIPGLLVIFLCVYMCQRAVATPRDSTAVLWLCSAAALNLAGGTVRQIAWLGALIMVPSTAWLLRQRRGVRTAGALLWIFSLAAVLLCLHWFNRQPYSVPEHVIWASVRPYTLAHLIAEIVKTLFCFLLVILPVSAGWFMVARRLDRSARVRVLVAVVLFIGLLAVTYAMRRIDTWLMPWLMYLLAEQSSLVPGMFGTPVAMVVWTRVALSLLVVTLSSIAGERLLAQWRNRPSAGAQAAISWAEAMWILGPFSLSYLLLLMPRGAFDLIQDRYLVGLMPIAIVFLLGLYQERVGSRVPRFSVAVLAVYALYSIAGTHDFFAVSRAQVHAIRILQRSGVPRATIQAGFPADGWLQIQNGGHINESRIQVPAGAFRRNVVTGIPEKCRDGFTNFAPIIHPRYFVLFPWFKNPTYPMPSWCFVGTAYPPVRYTTWLPPFHSTLFIQQLRNGAR